MNPLQHKVRALAMKRLGDHAGMVVGILQDGQQFVAGYGTLDSGQSPPSEDTVFEIGSVTKVFTTVLLAEMALHGEVALDDPAQKYVPSTLQLPTWRGQEFTLLHLATHTSSLPRLPRNLWKTVKNPANPYADYQVSDLYEFLSGCKLKHPIGSRTKYSNLGMGLLGHILGLVAGKSYEALVSERILRPLGMNDTSITLSAEQQARLAPGHTASGKVTANWDIPALAGAGALRSTAGDLLRFVAASMNRATGPLAEAASLCQRLYPKTGKARLRWQAYAYALLFSGLGVSAQWLFGLAPRDPSFVLAACWPMIFAAEFLGIGPGLIAAVATMAGSHFLQQGHEFGWSGLVMVGALSFLFSLRSVLLGRSSARDRSDMLGWQNQRLHLLKRHPSFVWHNGATGGYRSFVGFIPEQEVAVVVLANSAKSVDAVGVDILKLLGRET